MALTLPYPGLDFVPLDILTAEEMNEIVANYTFIAAQFPIGAASLDIPMFFHEERSQVITSGDTTMLNGMSWTIPQDGKYLAVLNGNAQPNQSTDSFPRVGFYVDDTRVAYSALHIRSDFQVSFSCLTVVDLTQGQILDARSYGGVVHYFEGFRMFARRLS